MNICNLTLLLVIVGSSLSQAQSVTGISINSGGMKSISSSVEMDSRIGDPVVKNLSGDNVSLNHSPAQSVLVITAVNELLQNIEISVFPNPTTSSIIINLNERNDVHVEYEIYKHTGELMSKNTLNDNHQIDMSSYTSGLYMLKIIDITRGLNSHFRVIKTDK